MATKSNKNKQTEKTGRTTPAKIATRDKVNVKSKANAIPAPRIRRTSAMKIATSSAQNADPIKNESEYNTIMQRIEELMNVGSEQVSFEQLQEIRQLSLLAQDYERKAYPLNLPETFSGIIEMKMYEMKLKQKEMAKVLHISDAKLSLVISGKQKPDVELLKKVHTELNVDAHWLLSLV